MSANGTTQYHDLTPRQVERKLRELVHRGEELLAEYKGQALDAATAEARYRVQYAENLLLSGEKTVPAREAAALVACKEALLQRKIAEAKAEATKAAMYMVRDHIAAVQTISAQLRSEMQTISGEARR